MQAAIQLKLLQVTQDYGYQQVTKGAQQQETLFQADTWNDFFDVNFFDFFKNRSLTFVDLRAKDPTEDVDAEVNAAIDAYKTANSNELPAIIVQVYADADFDLDTVQNTFRNQKAAYDRTAAAAKDSASPAATVLPPPPKVGVQDPREIPGGSVVDPEVPEDPAVVEAREKATAQYHKSLQLNFQSKWTYLNPTVGALFTAVSVVMGGLFAVFAPEALLAAASPWLMGIAALGALYTAIAFVPYVIHECFQHFNAWRFEAWKDLEDEHSKSKSNAKKTYSQYLDAVYGSAQTADRPAVPPEANMPGFGAYVMSLPTQLGNWIAHNKKTFAVVLLGLVVSGFLFGGAVAFFMGNPLITPVFTAMNTFIVSAFQAIGTAIPGFGFLADLAAMTQAVDIISAILMITIPLTLANVIRLIARADYQARLAGGSTLLGAASELSIPDGFDPASDEVDVNLSDEFRASKASGRLYDEFSANSKEVWAKIEKAATDGFSDVSAAIPLKFEKPPVQ